MPDAYLEITNGNLLLPISATSSRLFSRENLNRAVGGISKVVGGRIVSEKNHDYVHCLRDINISLKSGDRLGLIGHNGAGKTTLLKVMSGIYPIGTGDVQIKGEISTFISQGFGMNPEMTAVDYLEMQCTIRGFSRKETKEFISKVLDFIELGEFAFMPMRTYSSGMRSRLFATAAISFPCEILLIDEGIGAGDASFNDKFSKALDHFFESAKILVLASHSRELIEKWCNKAVVMNKGEAAFVGDVKNAFEFYEKLYA